MLAILIPTYNFNITRLATELHRQAMDQSIDFEIIVMEDGSEKWIKENKLIGELANCKHIILEDNTGRSAIRNKLADKAKFDHLLFMDCDAEVCSSDFIQKYLPFCNKECVVIGGTAYDPKEKNPDFSLRLKYGRVRETRTASERGKNNFSTFNFLISKSIFNQVRFDESIRGYGHEDMLFGHQLHQLGYEYIQIENPLIHKGLDDNRTFLSKTEEGTRNLFLLYQTGRYPFLADESKLLNTYIRIYKSGLTRLFALKFDLTRHLLRRLLSGKSPSLLLYDWYKLLFLCKTSLMK
jgi:glycosyltransferase involved in cell wall biosynthesis